MVTAGDILAAVSRLDREDPSATFCLHPLAAVMTAQALRLEGNPDEVQTALLAAVNAGAIVAVSTGQVRTVYGSSDTHTFETFWLRLPALRV